MKGTSRILAALGTLLMVAGILGPIFGFNGGTFFPGVVLLFIGRAMAKQAAGADKKGEAPVARQTLNTERARTAPPAPIPSPPRREPQRAPAPTEKTQMLESILLAGSEVADQKGVESAEMSDEEGGPQMSSQEMITGRGENAASNETEVKPRMSSEKMIAEARERWGHRP